MLSSLVNGFFFKLNFLLRDTSVQRTLTSVLVSVLQFSQASAVRSYTKFVMGVSSAFTLLIEMFPRAAGLHVSCFSPDCSECFNLSLHAGGRSHGSQQLWVSRSHIQIHDTFNIQSAEEDSNVHLYI